MIRESGLWVPDARNDPPKKPERKKAALHITIRRNADGVVRTAHRPEWFEWRNDDDYADEFWWSEGNYGCDCNRASEFARAGGEEPAAERSCGEDAYTILSITQDDDPTVLYSEA